MSNPIQRKSIDGAEGPETGSDTETLGHNNYGLFVAVDGDESGITVRLEGSPDRERWAVLDDPVNDPVELEAEDFNECPDSGQATAYFFGATRGQYIRYIRARIVDGPADGSVDVYTLAAGNAGGKGGRPTERSGPASDL